MLFYQAKHYTRNVNSTLKDALTDAQKHQNISPGQDT